MWGEPADFEDSFSLKGVPIVKCHLLSRAFLRACEVAFIQDIALIAL